MAQLQNLPRKNAQQKRPMPRADILLGQRLIIKRIKLSRDEQERLDNNVRNAVSEGNNAKIWRLIKAGADIAATDTAGGTALHWAAIYGRTETCAFLIKKYAELGGDVKKLIAAKEPDGETALYWAAANGYIQTCTFLLDQYAKAGGNKKKLITEKDNYGRRCLYDMYVAKLLTSTLGNEAAAAFLKPFNECFAA